MYLQFYLGEYLEELGALTISDCLLTIVTSVKNVVELILNNIPIFQDHLKKSCYSMDPKNCPLSSQIESGN